MKHIIRKVISLSLVLLLLGVLLPVGVFAVENETATEDTTIEDTTTGDTTTGDTATGDTTTGDTTTGDTATGDTATGDTATDNTEQSPSDPENDTDTDATPEKDAMAAFLAKFKVKFLKFFEWFTAQINKFFALIELA